MEFRLPCRRRNDAHRPVARGADQNAQGKVVAGISVFLDITESKLAEKIKNLARY